MIKGIDLAALVRKAGIELWGAFKEESAHENPSAAPFAGIVAALPYHCDKEDSIPEQLQNSGDLSIARDDSIARIAPFARRNYYKELAKRLMGIASEIHAVAGIEKNSLRVFVNSRIPEKPLALRAGLGFIGRNGLLITDTYGSQVVLGVLELPESLLEEVPAVERKQAGCESCTACVNACPTRAISIERGYERGQCLQEYAAKAEALPAQIEKAWGPRLYGCHSCQAVCPHNRFPQEGASCERGILGIGVNAREFSQLDEGEMKTRLAGSALGMSWIDPLALKRNALLALRYWESPRRD